jgi:hypothetical protein
MLCTDSFAEQNFVDDAELLDFFPSALWLARNANREKGSHKTRRLRLQQITTPDSSSERNSPIRDISKRSEVTQINKMPPVRCIISYAAGCDFG